MNKVHVLVLEGEPTLRTCLTQALVKNYQCRIQRAIGIRSLNPLVVITPRGIPKQLDCHFDFAFIDDCNEDPDCGRIVAELTRRGTKCIGLSFSVASNKAMLEKGACAALLKPFVVAAVMLSVVPALTGAPEASANLAEQIKCGETLYRRDAAKHQLVSDACDAVRKRQVA